ncbi:tail fiber assembly protein, partial [Serratia marcescens]|uniref:tail fiber assembly protein n=1 Tax=Serratia marcescens TaxID=615 RepID=UPI0011E6145C
DRWNGSAWVKDESAENAAIISEAGAQKLGLLQTANEHIAPLQDAVDLGIADEAEEAALLAWKKYRVLLYRVDTAAAPDIDWPVTPE